MKTYFEKNGLLGISGVDTRRLTIKTRLHGTLRASLIVGDDNGEYAVECARNVKPITDLDLISQVSCTQPYRIEGTGKRIAIIDLGIKKNMITSLRRRNADLYIFPHNARHDEIETCKPEALFITNGPGDPRMAHGAIACIQNFLGQIPIYGICMGNQVTALAFGAETYKMKFGHRGSNQPVRHKDGQIYITTQNHGFAVDGDTLPEECEIEYTNLNDGSLEGFSSRYHDVITVQFHPEAHGGPRETEQPFFDMIYRRIP